MTKKYDVSVVIASYQPNYEKMVMTVRSLFLQKDVSLQIVIADDGSDEDYFQEMEWHFSEWNFTDYELVKNPTNQGTVINCLSGFMRCKGEYIKPISPGDYMASDTTLRKWIDYMKEKDIDICGSDYFCYNNRDNGKMVAKVLMLHPRRCDLSGRALRESYILYDNIFLGAATLCKKKVLIKYVSKLAEKVKFAEDNCYRMMAYCGEKMGFYRKETIIYEVGTGISTSGEDKWNLLLKKDWEVSNDMLLNMEAEDATMKNAFKTLISIKSNIDNITLIHMQYKNVYRGVFLNIYKFSQYLKIRGLVLYKLRTKLKPRLSSDTLPKDWIRELGGECM